MERLSELEKFEVWDRFEGGEWQQLISRRLGRSPSTIRTLLLRSGFRRPVPGPEWSSLQLLLTEGEEISRGLAAGETMRCIASGLGRAGSTVSRVLVSTAAVTGIDVAEAVAGLTHGFHLLLEPRAIQVEIYEPRRGGFYPLYDIAGGNVVGQQLGQFQGVDES